jgi:hypothetical protein
MATATGSIFTNIWEDTKILHNIWRINFSGLISAKGWMQEIQ